MEQLDKEVIDELSEPANRVFRSLDYRSQRRTLKKAKEMGKQKKRKTQQKEQIKDTSAKILQAMLLGTTMSEETYESNSEKQGDLDETEKKIHSTPYDKNGQNKEITITAGMIKSAIDIKKSREEEERQEWFMENYDNLTLLDIYSSELVGEVRRNVVRDAEGNIRLNFIIREWSINFLLETRIHI